MKRVILKGIGLMCVLAMLMTMAIGVMPAGSAATVVHRPVQIQWTDYWKTVYYGGQHLYDTGCGIFATVNAIGYLTGNEMSVTEVAQWAYDIKALNYYAGGTDRTIMYPKLQEKFGKDYGFTVDCAGATGYWQNANTTLKNHLLSGGVAIGHVYGHFIAVVGYDASTKYYHVYDSAPSSARGTGNGDAWVSESWFTTSTYFTLDWFCLVTATGNPINKDYGESDVVVDTTTTADKLGTYEINTQQLNVRAGVGTTYDIVTTVKQGDVVNVTALSDGWGQFVAPDGVQGWANVGYYGKYIGVDALAATQAIAWGDVSSSVDENGRLTLVNNSTTGMAGYDFKLPFAIGTATTPYFETAVHVNNANGFFFGLSNGGAYYMMRDCNSGDQLVEETQAPYMKWDEVITVNLADWWKPAGGERIKMIRFYLAPGASITIERLYFAAEQNTVTDTRYNLIKKAAQPEQPEEPETTLGDVNNDGEISTTDARMAMLCALESTELTGAALAAADYNGDGEVTTTDARLMMLYALTH